MEKVKLENQLRLLQLKHGFQEAQIWDAEEKRQNQKLELGDDQSSVSSMNTSEENISSLNGSNIQPIIIKAPIGLQDPSSELSDNCIQPGEYNRSNTINIRSA
ncbi:hypothetical protein JTB14_033377 [Gonioctena quinquepunctata]|nr:hypothetical protein JTB14_033377 [Gonioctena quinquepunctata]